jgi:4-aminobutyrate aminotransferase
MNPGKPTSKARLIEGDSNLSTHRRQWQARHLDDETRRWLKKDADYFLHQSLSTPCLNVLSESRELHIVDLLGRETLDFHGNSAHQVGYGHPKVIAEVKKQLDIMPFCPRRYTNIPAIELAAKLTELAPGNLNKVLLAPGGTSAVGMALKLARVATGRFKTVSMWESFHGASLDAISVGGEALFRKGIGPLLPGTEHVPPANPYRCLWNSDGDCSICDLRCARYIEYVLEQEGDVAAVVAEPIRCTNVNPPPPGYWKHVRRACDRHGALLIFDETAVCLGRTGRMFACEHEAVVPDILILGRDWAAQFFPWRQSLHVKIWILHRTRPWATIPMRRIPSACAAALATIDVIESENLLENAETLGSHAMARLHALSQHEPIIGDVRGRGLLFGLDLVLDKKTKAPACDEADRVLYHCLEQWPQF